MSGGHAANEVGALQQWWLLAVRLSQTGDFHDFKAANKQIKPGIKPGIKQPS
jgi:hypothetical protein